ncbi:MAG: PAS domain S-box protein [Promethearchaeota archaeon]|jgi:PAS domain S-box-containing protein
MRKVDPEIKLNAHETLPSSISYEKLQGEVRTFQEKYLVLFNNSTSGIAYHKILYDSNKKPINYIITDVNPQYETILNIKKEDVINKIATKVYNVSEPPYINIYSKVAETQKSHLFETYFQPMNKYFKISVISSRKGEFITVFNDISERKRSDLKLKESEDSFRESEIRFRSLVEATSDWIWEIDKNGRYTYSSPKIKDLLGYDPQEIIGKSPFDFMAISQFETLRETYLNLFKSKRQYSSLINKCRHKNGTIISLETSGVPIFNENGVFEGYRGIDRDITERIKANQRIKRSEEEYRELVNDANSIILKWDINGKISFINEFGEILFGYSKSQLVGKHVIGTIVPKTETTGRDLERLMKEICKNPEKYKNNINENITRYGRKLWILWTNKAIKDDQGNLTGILSVGNDMTDRRRAAQEIKESEEKFRTITEQNFIGIAILQDYKLNYVNQQFSETLGYSPKELIKWKSKKLFDLVHPEDRDSFFISIANRDRNEGGIPLKLQFRILTKTGSIIWLEIFSKSITYKGRQADLISTMDITGKKEAERIVLEENRKLIALNKMRKDIITRVSHELKTPLTSIYGASQLLLKHLNLSIDDEVLNFIEIFHRGALRLKKLVENLTDASRIEYGKLELNIKQFDLITIIKECIDEMSYLIDNRKLILNSELPNKLLVNVDKIRLQQVITNILSNAIKNTPMNGNINVSLVNNLEYTDIQIRDSGVGLTEKEKELLFEKFGKIERYGMDLGVDIEGSGLGLYIAKEIVDLHGGQILVESEGRNKGALFTIRLNKNI